MMKRLIQVFCLLWAFLPALAQQPPPVKPLPTTGPIPAADTTFIEIRNTDRYSHKTLDSLTEIETLAGNVRLKDKFGGTYFECDSAIINLRFKTVEAFGRVYINDGDSVKSYSRYMKYESFTKLMNLKNSVKVIHGKGTLTTEDLLYDMSLKMGSYKNGGRLVNKKTILTSREGFYFQDTKEARFYNGVVMTDPRYTINTDSLYYNTETEDARFNSRTFIKDSSGRTIETTNGHYDMRKGIAQFEGRTVIKDGDVTVSADRIANDEKAGLSQLAGNAVFVDKKQGITVIANSMFRDEKNGTFLATQKPVMIIKQEDDSIYVAADTLFMGRLSNLGMKKDSLGRDTLKGVNVVSTKEKDKDSTNRYFEAFHNVRIFSDSLQATSDSLFYSFRDSVFQLFQKPVIWSNNSQILGDTIFLYTKNKKADRFRVFENALVINRVNDQFYNQLAGNTLNGYFKDGEIDFMRAKVNAESIYFVQDDVDSSFVGVNKVKGDQIDLLFNTKKLEKVLVQKGIDGAFIPIRLASPSEMKLTGFTWLEDKRPKTRIELFE